MGQLCSSDGDTNKNDVKNPSVAYQGVVDEQLAFRQTIKQAMKELSDCHTIKQNAVSSYHNCELPLDTCRETFRTVNGIASIINSKILIIESKLKQIDEHEIDTIVFKSTLNAFEHRIELDRLNEKIGGLQNEINAIDDSQSLRFKAIRLDTSRTVADRKSDEELDHMLTEFQFTENERLSIEPDSSNTNADDDDACYYGDASSSSNKFNGLDDL
jgi:hypothetical protein